MQVNGPYAVVLEFRGARARGFNRPPPEALHAAFLGLIGRGDRALAKLLHSPKMGLRPFSLHPLGLPGEDGRIRLRLSILAPELFARFWERWEKRGGIPLSIKRSSLSPASLSGDGPWCGSASWKDLASTGTDREIELLFATPTTFRAGDLDLPLPVPRLVFAGLLRKWNAFSPISLNISLEELERRVAMAGANVRTLTFYDGRSHIVGFVGRALFRVLRGASPDLLRAVNTLARFAFFAGVGRKTTHGMGLVRVIEP